MPITTEDIPKVTATGKPLDLTRGIIQDDLSGKQYGVLRVLAFAGKYGHNPYWYCECTVCGSRRVVMYWVVKNEKHSRCTCDKSALASTHGMSYSAEYSVWSGMRQRCSNPNDPKFYLYGGRGIKVCARWGDFANFYEDMGPKRKGMTLERIDGDKDYSPENCIWADYKTQNRNRKINHYITYKGKTQCIAAWVEEYGLDYNLVAARIRRYGDNYDKVFARTNFRETRFVEYQGKRMTVSACARQLKMNKYTFLSRLNRGTSAEEIAKTKVKCSKRLYKYQGEALTAGQWACRIGITRKAFIGRLKRGWSLEKAITTGKLVNQSSGGSPFNVR